MNAAGPPLLWRSTRSNASSSSVRQSRLAVGRGEPGAVGVRREHRHRPDGRRAVAAPSGRVRRRGRATGHAVPALGESDDLPPAGHHLGQPQGGLVGLGARRQQQHLRQSRRQRPQRLGEVDHRSRQHPREQVVEPSDHLGDDGDDLRVRVPEDRAHLAAGEVEHPPAGGILDERACRPLGDERRPRRPVAQEVAVRPPQGFVVRHRSIMARSRGGGPDAAGGQRCSTGSTGRPAPCQAPKPPSMCPTSVNPRVVSESAARAERRPPAQ